MTKKPPYEELEKTVKELKKELLKRESLEERLDLLSLAVEQSNDGIAISDLDGDLKFTNSVFTKMHGYSPEELVGKNLSIFHTPEQLPYVEAANLELKHTGRFKGEIWHLKCDGTVFPTLMHNSLIRDEKNKPIGMMATLRDISDIKQAEEAMRESEKRYRRLVETMNDGIGIQDENGLITYVNNKFCQMLDYKSDDFIGKPVTDFLDDHNRQILTKQTSVRRKGKVKPYEIEWTCKDGRKIQTIMSPQAIFNNNGQFKGSFSVITDISDRKQAEEALRDSEEFISSLLNNSPHPILVINPDTSVRYVSPALETLTGFSSEEIIGRKAPYPWWTEETIQKTGEDLREAMRKGAKKVEELFNKKNGERFWVKITSVPIRENGVFKYYLASWVDITDHKQAEEALRESEGKLNAMLQSIGDHISMIDKDLNIIWANETAKSVFGKNIIGKKCYEAYHQRKESCEPYPCITLKAFQDGKNHKHETEVIDKSRRKMFFHCTANIALRDKQGNPTAVLEISREITEHKQAELALIERGKELENKTHELEEVNAALRVLLKHRDEDKKDIEDKVVANVKELVFPYVEKLNNSRLNNVQMIYLNIIKSNLEDIVAPFLRQLSLKFSDLTPSEIQVAGLVKDGKTTKEIADLLNSSTGAVNFHRNNIRKKLGLRNTKTNLRSFLLPLS